MLDFGLARLFTSPVARLLLACWREERTGKRLEAHTASPAEVTNLVGETHRCTVCVGGSPGNGGTTGVKNEFSPLSGSGHLLKDSICGVDAG